MAKLSLAPSKSPSKAAPKPSKVHAFAANGVGQTLKPFDYEPPELGPWDVEVKVTHCGMCHSDLHLINDDLRFSVYPLVPGHEIIGLVTRRGVKAANLQIGQRVGIGWQRGGCM